MTDPQPAGETDEQSLDEIQAEQRAAEGDPDRSTDLEPTEDLEYTLPGDDIVTDDLDSIKVLPKQQDEFICHQCFLVHHASQRHGTSNICRECAE